MADRFFYLESMQELKTIVTVPWAANENSWKNNANRVSDEAAAYSRVPLIFRAIRLRTSALSRVPVYVYQGTSEEPIDSYAFEDSLPLAKLLVLSELSLLLKGAAFNLKLSNSFSQSLPSGFVRGLQWLNPFTIQYQQQQSKLYFWQQLPGGERYPKDKQFWTVEDFFYLREFNPLDDLGWGISPTSVALNDGAILSSVTAFLANFFTGDALPVTLVTLAKDTLDPERERVQNWFLKKLRGLRDKAYRVLAITGDIKIEKLNDELKTMDFAGVDQHAIADIAWAFDIPKTLLTSDSANFATASSEYRTFLEYTIIPRATYYETEINNLLELAGTDQHIEFAPQEMTELQEDEAIRAGSLRALTDAGVPLDAALDILGYDISEKAQASIDKKLAAPPVVPPVPTNGKHLPQFQQS